MFFVVSCCGGMTSAVSFKSDFHLSFRLSKSFGSYLLKTKQAYNSFQGKGSNFACSFKTSNMKARDFS